MYISLKLKNIGDTKLTLLPVPDVENDNEFILVRNEKDLNTPFLSLRLDENHFVVTDQHDIDMPEEQLAQELDELALEVIAAIQRGDDLSDVTLGDVDKPYNPDKIRVESKNFSLRQIYDMIKMGDLNLHPDFQRNLVWDNFRKSRLIESILLRIPLPMFYFSQDDDGVLSVVDGLQRLSAIYEFMEDRLVLKDLEYLDNCNNKTYSGKENRIDDKYVRWFNMTQIVVNVIDPQSPSKVKFDIFRRINTGGRPLNAQELRNCLAGNGLRTTLKKMVDLKSFKEATSKSIKDTRMDAQELALRFIYFYRLIYKEKLGVTFYSGNMDDELDNLVDEIGKDEAKDLDVYVKAFDKAMASAEWLFGKHAFRKVHKDTLPESGKSVINKALFVSMSVLLSRKKAEAVRCLPRYAKIASLGKEMDENAEYRYYMSYGTNGKKNIECAFKVAEKLLKDIGNDKP